MRAVARGRPRPGSPRTRISSIVSCPHGHGPQPGRTRGSRGPGHLLRGVRNAARDPARPRPGGSGRQPRGSRIGDVTWARITQAGIDPRRTQHAPPRTRRPAPARSPPHPVSAGSARTCLDSRDRHPTCENVCRGYDLAGRVTISRPGRRARCGGADEGRGGVRPGRQQDQRERAHRHRPGNPHGRGDETSALTTRTRFTSSRPSPRSLFSGLMVALSCSDHPYAVGPRWSNRRSRGWNAHLEVRGAAAPGAAVHEIVG